MRWCALFGSMCFVTQGGMFEATRVMRCGFESFLFRAQGRGPLSAPLAIKIHLAPCGGEGGEGEEGWEEGVEVCEREHARLRRVGGSSHWVGLAAEVGSHTRGLVGGEEYACLFLQPFEGSTLAILLSNQSTENTTATKAVTTGTREVPQISPHLRRSHQARLTSEDLAG